MFHQNLFMDSLSSFGNDVDGFSNDPSQSLELDSQFRHPKLDDVVDLPTASNASPLTKKRRPVGAEVVRQRIESGQWHRKQMVGSSLRFQFFDELMEGNKSLELIICRLCDSAYSIHSRSHCLEHIKQRHPEVITESLVNGRMDDVDRNDFNEANLLSHNAIDSAHSSLMMLNELNNSQNNSPLLSLDPRWQNLSATSGDDLLNKDLSLDAFNRQPNPIATPLIKRRRLITTEMAKCRLNSGEWQLRSVAGSSVRCRFFYEIYEGESPLNTLSCKLCGATYSTQSRSHYREHVRRRHSEVYCVRSGRVSNNTTFDNPNLLQSSNSNSLRHAAVNGSGHSGSVRENDEDDNFSLQFLNIPGMAEPMPESPLNNSLLNADEGLGSNFGSNSTGIGNNGGHSALKMRRIITTETVMNHLEAGDWSRKAIPGMSIRSRFFDEIVEGETTLNILICKLCGSTYSAQSRSHCVEHVKKRHLSILEGNEEAADFEIDAWRETRKPGNPTLPPLQAEQLQNKPVFDKNKHFLQSQQSMQQKNRPALSFSSSSSQRRKKLLVSVAGPDQTIETPSIDSILQSLASQALFQSNSNSNDGIEEDFMEPEDYKFDLSAINNIINGGATSSSAVNRKRNRVGDSVDEHSQKRQNTGCESPFAEGSDSVSPPPGINDQLFALSNYADEEISEEVFEKKVNETDNGNARSPSTGSNSGPSASAVMRVIRPVSLQQSQKQDDCSSISPVNNGGHQQQLNHQQLLMAARTAALLSSNATDIGDTRSPSPQMKNQQTNSLVSEHNGFLRSNYGLHASQIPSQFSGISNSSSYRNMYGMPHQHSSYNPSGMSNSNNNTNFYQTAIQRQQQHEMRQRQLFELQQYQQRSLLQQQQKAQLFAARQKCGVQSQRSIGAPAQLSRSEVGNLPLANAQVSGNVPAGLLPPSFLNSRVVVGNNVPNALSNNSASLKSNSLSAASVDKIQKNSETSLNNDNSNSFCKNCKSEFPNVLRGLNELYGRVNNLIEVMHVALGSINSNQPANGNVAKALQQLEKTAASGVDAVNSFASSAIVRNAISKAVSATPSLEEAPILEANDVIENVNEEDRPEIRAEIVESDEDGDCTEIGHDDVENQLADGDKNVDFSSMPSLVTNSKVKIVDVNVIPTLGVEEEEDDGDDQSLKNEEDDEVLAAMVNLGGAFTESIDLTTQTKKIEKRNDVNATPIMLDEGNKEFVYETEKKKVEGLTLSAIYDANSTTSSNIRDVYLSFLEKEILKTTPDKFNLEILKSVSSIVQKSRQDKVTAALEHLTSRGLLETSAESIGKATFTKNSKRIEQLTLE